jgi:hypothetical protein
MNVNFNNLRKQAVYAYDRLAEKLNRSKAGKESHGEYIDGFGRIYETTIILDCEDIQDEMDDLRSMIGSIAMVYREGEDEFKDVYSEIFPEGGNKKMAEFNPED